MSRADLVLAFRTSLADGGWPIDWADAVADENSPSQWTFRGRRHRSPARWIPSARGQALNG